MAGLLALACWLRASACRQPPKRRYSSLLWNSVNRGPKRDIAGEWQKAARKYGLRFGMTEHLVASWWFYSSAKQSDKSGLYAGVPYDGTDPKYADLYWRGNEDPNGMYYIPNAPDFVKKTWFDRIKDMVDRYQPDLLYSDSPLPYPDEYGLNLLTQWVKSVPNLGRPTRVLAIGTTTRGCSSSISTRPPGLYWRRLPI